MNIEQRYLDAINTLTLANKGSLWFIDDNIWKTAVDKFVIKRKKHSGLVFAQKHYKSLKDIVPIMIGTSKDNYGFQVRRVMGDLTQKPFTYFSVIRPCPVHSNENSSSDLIIKEFTGSNLGIRRNQNKPNLDADEMQKLDDYLEKRGLHI